VTIPHFSNFGSLKSTETRRLRHCRGWRHDFSNFGSLKSTETDALRALSLEEFDFSNFGSLKSTETLLTATARAPGAQFQQFRLVEEH